MKSLDKLGELEKSLVTSLRQVKPGTEFVSKLRTRLEQQPPVILERRSQGTAFVVIGFGLLAGSVLLRLFLQTRKKFQESLAAS